LPVRICVIAELIALCAPTCVSRIAFPGRTPSLKSSLPCLHFSQAYSHSFLIARRIVDFEVAMGVRRESGSGRGSAFALAFGSALAAAFVA
jgi:hypothetical protein